MYLMSTACGRPQGEGVRFMWTHVDRGGGKKPDFVDVLNGWPQYILQMSFMGDA